MTDELTTPGCYPDLGRTFRRELGQLARVRASERPR
jgi:hypothetical protein